MTERRIDKRGRTLRTAAERRKIVEEFESSGQRQADFCRDRSLNATTFNNWVRGKYDRAGKRRKSKRKVEFAKVEVASASTCSHTEVEIELPKGVKLNIRHRGSAEELNGLLRGVLGKC